MNKSETLRIFVILILNEWAIYLKANVLVHAARAEVKLICPVEIPGYVSFCSFFFFFFLKNNFYI